MKTIFIRALASRPMSQFYVYILASARHGTLYVGVTNNLIRRVHEHREKLVRGFTRKYGVTRLVYYEIFDDAASAIAREKQLKRWKRDFKTNVIERDNPHWADLYPSLASPAPVEMSPTARHPG